MNWCGGCPIVAFLHVLWLDCKYGTILGHSSVFFAHVYTFYVRGPLAKSNKIHEK